MSEGRRKGFNIELYKELRNRVSTQLVAHGGAGSFEDIKKIFLETNVDAVSLSSMLHYNYLKNTKDKKIQGNIVFINSVDNTSSNENLIEELKLYLNKNGVPVRIEKKVGLVDTGTSNIKSVFYALKLFDTEIINIESDSNDKIDYMVVPGIGSFKTVMKKLKEKKLDNFIKKNIASNIPSLFICVGMQILFSKSYEFGETSGLDILKGSVIKIPNDFKNEKLNVPFIGWNKLNYKKIVMYFRRLKKKIFLFYSFILRSLKTKNCFTSTNYFGFETALLYLIIKYLLHGSILKKWERRFKNL